MSEQAAATAQVNRDLALYGIPLPFHRPPGTRIAEHYSLDPSTAKALDDSIYFLGLVLSEEDPRVKILRSLRYRLADTSAIMSTTRTVSPLFVWDGGSVMYISNRISNPATRFGFFPFLAALLHAAVLATNRRDPRSAANTRLYAEIEKNAIDEEIVVMDRIDRHIAETGSEDMRTWSVPLDYARASAAVNQQMETLQLLCCPISARFLDCYSTSPADAPERGRLHETVMTDLALQQNPYDPQFYLQRRRIMDEYYRFASETQPSRFIEAEYHLVLKALTVMDSRLADLTAAAIAFQDLRASVQNAASD